MKLSAVISRSGSGFAHRLDDLLAEIDYRIVASDEEREQVYRLRYEAYLREGMTKANALGQLSDDYDDASNAWIFGLYIDDELTSSIRVCVASREHGVSPAVGFFPDILVPDIDAGRVIVDPNRLVTDKEASRLYPELAYMTVRLGYVAAVHFEADVVTATVRAEHRAFYKRVFGMQPDSLPRVIPPIEKPFCLMSFRDASMEPILNRYPVFRSTEAERARLFGGFAPRPGVGAGDLRLQA